MKQLLALRATWWWAPWLLAAALLAIGVPLRSLAQPDGLYFPATGHQVSDEAGFLSYWRSQGGEQLLGMPVTEAVTEGELTVQYFERGRLEQHPELAGAPLLLGHVGREYAAATWQTFEPLSREALPEGLAFFELTGHSLGEPFLSFWNANGGLAQFGYPLSEPRWEFTESGQIQVQYFERVRLEHHPLSAGTPDEVRISSLGRDLAVLRGHDLTPVANQGYATFGSDQALAAVSDAEFVALAVPAHELIAAQQEPAPAPAAEPAVAPAAVEAATNAAPVAAAEAAPAAAPVRRASGGKLIVVSIGDQWLYAYEGDTLVFDAPISTGKDGFNTPTGTYSVYAKTPKQTMSGTIGGEYYNVPNVPSVMYINGGVALHGTYWHNMFGSGVRMSHGCINLPLGSAAWLYDWAPMGTTVKVVY